MSDDVIGEVRERHRLAREAGIGVPMYEVALLAEIARLRSALTAMHRRAQRAESIADRVAADRPQGAAGRGLGRALANYAAHRAAQERDEARAEVERLRRRISSTPPWPTDREPLDDEQMRALMLRWSTGPELYQADADALIATVLHARAERSKAVDALRMIRAGYRTALDQARRAALEEAIATVREVESAQTYGAPVVRVCLDAVRALIDTPRTDPVRPAPVSASEER